MIRSCAGEPRVWLLGLSVCLTWGIITERATAQSSGLAAPAGEALRGALDCPAGSRVITGTARADWLVGTPFRDCILGLDGDDMLLGLGADDVLVGGAGNDMLLGGGGRDTLRGEAGDDWLFGGTDDDRLEGGNGNDTLNGEYGADVVRGGACNDQIHGDRGDRIYGDGGMDRVTAPAWYTQIDGGDGVDACSGAHCELSGWSARVCYSDRDCGHGFVCVPNTGLCVKRDKVPVTDATCDGVDDDCDGLVDEDYTPSCSESGVQLCVAGRIQVQSCDDGNSCSEDQCSAGSCQHTARLCNDGNACTADACDAALGCVHRPTSNGCDDGNACTTGDRCQPDATCAGGPVAVDDNNPCTNDSCSQEDGIQHVPAEGRACSDGDACTTRDACSATAECVPGPRVSCDDGQFCNGLEQCDAELGCRAGTAPVVDDGNACTADRCDEASDQVLHIAIAAACDDGVYCNGQEQCDATRGCVAGAAPVVDDGIACTLDSCDEVSDQVTHVAVAEACDDGAFCNGPEQCDLAVGCMAGVAPVLDDGVACTEDSCDEQGDRVVHEPRAAACDDGAFCNGTELCDVTRGCLAGAAPVVDDGVACTEDSCDEQSDRVVHEPRAAMCDDGAFCNGAELCDVTRGCVAGAAPVVDDGVACTTDRCDEEGDGVVHQPSDAACDDQNICTGTERCDATLGCQPGVPLPIESDNNPCTLDTCDPRTGETVHTPDPCDDGTACTSDSCDPSSGCRHVANSLACNDGSGCTIDDVCSSGSCFGGGARDCDDANDCTAESCGVQENQCQYTAVPDGVACRLGAGTCMLGSCVMGCTPSAHAPQVSRVSDLHAVVGLPASFTLAASDQDGDTLTYSLLGAALPAGLSLDPSTGVISGTPAPAALSGAGMTHRIVVGVSDGCLRTSTNAFSIQVSGVPLPQPTALFDFDNARFSNRVLSSAYGGFSGQLVGTARTGVASKVGQRFEFTGQGWLRVGDQRSTLKTAGSMTVAMALDGAAVSSEQVYYSCGIPGESRGLAYAFRYGVRADGRLQALHETGNVDNVSISTQTAGSGPRAIAFVRDATARTYRSFINGNQDSGGAVTYASNANDFTDCIVTIASDDETAAPARSALDELAIWHQTLDANQVATVAWLYRKGISVESWVQNAVSCDGILSADPSSIAGQYVVQTPSGPMTVTCPMGD